MQPTPEQADATALNLRILWERISRQQEKAIAFLSELGEQDAHLLARRSGPAAPILRNIFPRDAGPTPHATHLSEHRAALSFASEIGAEALYPAYVNALLSASQKLGNPLTLADFIPLSQAASARIAYMKNPYADEAYEQFAPRLPSPTASYVDSYRAACEEVAAREADFCILPYENASGFLTATEALAERYSLFRVHSCRVFHADGTDATHFALYGREFIPADKEAACTLLFRFPYKEDAEPARFLSAAGVFGVHCTRLLCEEWEDEDSPLCARVTARIPKKTLIPFLTYLSVFVREAAIYGLYKENE